MAAVDREGEQWGPMAHSSSKNEFLQWFMMVLARVFPDLAAVDDLREKAGIQVFPVSNNIDSFPFFLTGFEEVCARLVSRN